MAVIARVRAVLAARDNTDAKGYDSGGRNDTGLSRACPSAKLAASSLGRKAIPAHPESPNVSESLLAAMIGND